MTDIYRENRTYDSTMNKVWDNMNRGVSLCLFGV